MIAIHFVHVQFRYWSDIHQANGVVEPNLKDKVKRIGDRDLRISCVLLYSTHTC